jgi:NADH:ubiquinone oxidoreductase subunit C
VHDNLTQPNRFVITYLFLSYRFNQRIVLKTFGNETTAIPSITARVKPLAPRGTYERLFSSAAWLEREA